MWGPKGIGVFVWLPQHCEGGDSGRIAAKAVDCGVSWLACHNYVPPKATVDAWHAAGLQVAWSEYSVPGQARCDAFIQYAKGALDSGVDAILVDAETAWETGTDGRPGYRGPEAADFASALRTVVGPKWIGNAGAWQRPMSHTLYPDREFAAAFDAALPERYWTEFPPTTSYAESIGVSEQQWSTYRDVQGYRSVFPVGSAYGTNTSPPGGHQPLQPADFADFIRRYPALALWSWMHVPDWAWVELKKRAAEPSPPEPADDDSYAEADPNQRPWGGG